MKNLPAQHKPLETQVLSKLSQKETELVVLHFNQGIIFGAMTNENKQDLAKLLVKLSYFIGIKEPVTIDNLKLLVSFLCTRFPMMTMEQLETAFMMACSGELGDDFEHYQNFSPIYISKVIKAYDTKRYDAIRKYTLENQKYMQQKEEEERAKNFNPLESCTTSLILEYELYIKEGYRDLNKIRQIGINWLLVLLRSYNMFVSYNEEKHVGYEFLERYFVTLPKDVEEAKAKIVEDVKTRFSQFSNE